MQIKRMHYLLLVVLIISSAIAGVQLVSTAGADDEPAELEEHCVGQMMVTTADGEVLQDAGKTRCFDTQAEAVRYATNGTVDLPEAYSHDEFVKALQDYNASQAQEPDNE